jgi:hypothetical protein
MSWRIKEGFLVKRGHIVPSFRRRFFSLDGPTLYYTVAPGKEHRGEIDLRGATLNSSDDIGSGNFSFTITESGAPGAAIISEEWGLPGSDRSSGRSGPTPPQESEKSKSSYVRSFFSSSTKAPPSQVSGSGALYLLQAESEAERAAWLDCIGANIKIIAEQKAQTTQKNEILTSSSGSQMSSIRSKSDGTIEDAAFSLPLKDTTGINSSESSSESLLIDSTRKRYQDPSPDDLPSSIKIFTGTWNMAEELPPATFSDWILPGCDIYAISLQECMHVTPFLAVMKTILGPTYLEVHEKIGSSSKVLGFHGHIVIAIFVKDWLVSRGICRLSRTGRGKVALGRNLYLTRAENKGGLAVALPIRLPDANGALNVSSALVFASCHLTSDSKGKTRLLKRNRDAKKMMQGLGLDINSANVERAKKQAGSQIADMESKAAAADIVTSTNYNSTVSQSVSQSQTQTQLLIPTTSASVHGRASRIAAMGASRGVAINISGLTKDVINPNKDVSDPNALDAGDLIGAAGDDAEYIDVINTADIVAGDDAEADNAEDEDDVDDDIDDALVTPQQILTPVAFNFSEEGKGGSDVIIGRSGAIPIASSVIQTSPVGGNNVDSSITGFSSLGPNTSSNGRQTPQNEPDIGLPIGSQSPDELSGVSTMSTNTNSLSSGSVTNASESAVSRIKNPLGIFPGNAYTFISGDFNYRLDCSLEESLQAIVSAGIASSKARSPGSLEASLEVTRSWQRLLRSDQMLKEMAGNEKGERIFNGFFEPPVEFPPSYRRIKSENPLLVRSRGDLMDLQKVNDAYATFVHKKGGSEVIISRRSNSISSKDESTSTLLIQETSSLPGTPRSSTPGGNSTTELDNSSQLSISLNYQSQRRLSGVTTPVAVGSDDDPESLKKSQLRVPSYTDRCLSRSPLLAGVKVSEASFSAALKARRQKSSEKRDSDSVMGDVSSTTITTGSDLDDLSSTSLKRKGSEVVFVGGPSKSLQQSQVDDQSNSSAGRDAGETVSRMFVPLPPLRCLYYDSCDTVSNSDHAPITAIWDLSLRSGTNDILHNSLNSITGPPPFPMSVPSPLQLFSRQQRSGRDTPATDESLSRPQSRLNLSEAAKEGESPLASINKIQTSTDSIPIVTVRLLKPSEPLFDSQRNQNIADSLLVAPSILSMLQSEAKAADAADAAALRRKRINSGIGAASVQRIVDAGLAAPPAGVVGDLTE